MPPSLGGYNWSQAMHLIDRFNARLLFYSTILCSRKFNQ